MRTANWPLVTGESACVAIPALHVQSPVSPVAQNKDPNARYRRSLHSDFTRYGLSLTPSTGTLVREGLVDDPTGDQVEHFISQRHGELPVESWDDEL